MGKQLGLQFEKGFDSLTKTCRMEAKGTGWYNVRCYATYKTRCPMIYEIDCHMKTHIYTQNQEKLIVGYD